MRSDPSNGGQEFQLPQEGPALRIAALGAELPAGGSLTLRADGSLRRLYVPQESGMAIRGVALRGHILIEGGALTGELAEPSLAGDDMLLAGATVRLDLATGKIEPTTRSSVIER